MIRPPRFLYSYRHRHTWYGRLLWSLWTHVDAEGVWLDYRGDQIAYIWPWRRRKATNVWASTTFYAYYPTLKVLNAEWKSYDDACIHAEKKDILRVLGLDENLAITMNDEQWANLRMQANAKIDLEWIRNHQI